MKTANVLIVEDDNDSREFFKDMLTSQGFQTDTCSNGADAIEKVKAGSFDIVLLDIMMEEIDGIEVLKKIREDPNSRNLPVCMITASVDVEKVVQAFKSGADAYIVKPFDIDELIKKIKELIY